MSTRTPIDPKFEALLDYLRSSRGFDFSGYKRLSLMRRVAKRMSTLQVDDFSTYIDYLEADPDEFALLFNTILINVTTFFRDDDAWEYLNQEIGPKVITRGTADDTIRIWSAGCAAGQEPLSLAMMFCELLGVTEFQRRVKIYATDWDEEALAQARQASYTETQVETLPAMYLEKYFSRADGRYVFRPDLRRAVIFGRHDLIQDAPISHLDLLVCRNTLMYLNAETQATILARMHFALRPTGYLFLGKAEMLLSHGNLFSQVDLKHRVFSKVSSGKLRDLSVRAYAAEDAHPEPSAERSRLCALAIDAVTKAHVVVDGEGKLVVANDKARSMFGVKNQDLGRAFHDLEISYRPIELRSVIDRCKSEKRAVNLTRVPRALANNRVEYLDVEITPLFSGSDDFIGVTITADDVTEYYQLYDDMQTAHQELETTNEELQSTNEELETTNEELQSTNEELETTNEELQSGNEELETMNEELHSANEELETINQEITALAAEVRQNHDLLDSVLASMHTGVIVVDHNGRITGWNSRSAEVWGLRNEEVIGRTLQELDIGLPLEEIQTTLSDPLPYDYTGTQMRIEAINRRGKKIICNVRVGGMHVNGKLDGFVILVEDEMAAKLQDEMGS